jgi:hypothetical protein
MEKREKNLMDKKVKKGIGGTKGDNYIRKNFKIGPLIATIVQTRGLSM